MGRTLGGGVGVSRQAIAAALARGDRTAGERLVAFSLASFADSEQRAWPGASAAGARAGLGRSRYLEAREQLVHRGLVVVEHAATGRGRSSTLGLRFASDGPWWEGEINAELFEAVLAFSAARGPARLLLVAMGAIAGEDGVVEDLSTEQLCAAAGLADRTYRRARKALLASGELVLLSGIGGRGNTNRWQIPDPRLGEAKRRATRRRVAPPAGARPLVLAVPDLAAQGLSTRVDKGGHDAGEVVETRTEVASVKGGQDRTVSPQNRPGVTGVSGVKGGQDRTLLDPDRAETPAETPAQTPAQTPALSARAGRERRIRAAIATVVVRSPRSASRSLSVCAVGR